MKRVERREGLRNFYSLCRAARFFWLSAAPTFFVSSLNSVFFSLLFSLVYHRWSVVKSNKSRDTEEKEVSTDDVLEVGRK